MEFVGDEGELGDVVLGRGRVSGDEVGNNVLG